MQSGVQGSFASPISVPEDTASSMAVEIQATPQELLQTTVSGNGMSSPLVDNPSQPVFTQHQSVIVGMVEESLPTQSNSPPEGPPEEPQPFGSPSAISSIPLPPLPRQVATNRLAAALPNQDAASTDLWNQLWDEASDSSDHAVARRAGLWPLGPECDQPSSLPSHAAAASPQSTDRLLSHPKEDGAVYIAPVQQQLAERPAGDTAALRSPPIHDLQPSALPSGAAKDAQTVDMPEQLPIFPSQAIVAPVALLQQPSNVLDQATTTISAIRQEPADLPSQAIIAAQSTLRQRSDLPNEPTTPHSSMVGAEQTTSLYARDSIPSEPITPRLISSFPNEAGTPNLKSRLPEEAMLPNIVRVASVRGVSATPKTAGAREYGSWWTPHALTPAWMKMKTPSWVKKMRQPDMVIVYLFCAVLSWHCRLQANRLC